MRTLAILPLCIAVASCSTQAPVATPSPAAGVARPGPNQGQGPVQSSPECLAANLKPSDPFPVSAIPEAVLKKAQSGSVAMRYDVVAGAARNIAVVASTPPGLYDAYALQHASRYRDPGGKTVSGCVMVIDIRF